VLDDWFRKENLTVQYPNFDDLAYMRDTFRPQTESLFYRPLGLIFLLGVERGFGLNELGYHAIHLFFHFAGGLVVAAIAYRLTRDRLLAWIVGIVAAGSVVVRLFPSLWMVGSYDIVGGFFFLLALYAFMRRWILASAGAFLIALLFKEASIALVLIVAVFSLLYRSPEGGLGPRAKALGRELWPFVLLAGLWLIPKVQGISPFSLSATDPYKIDLDAGVFFESLKDYLAWSGRSILPSENLGLDIAVPPVFTGAELAAAAVGIAVLAVAAIWLDRGRPGLAPVLSLPNQRHQYYLVYSLPAFLILAAGGLASLLSLRVRDRRLVVAPVALCAAGVLVANVVQTYQLERDVSGRPVAGLVGLGLLPYAYGQTVERVERALAAEVPTLDGPAAIMVDGIDAPAFWYASGPRVIYENAEIEFVNPGTGATSAGPVLLLRPDPERPREVEVVRLPDVASAEALIG
jgi:hypothetical protein